MNIENYGYDLVILLFKEHVKSLMEVKTRALGYLRGVNRWGNRVDLQLQMANAPNSIASL